ncbi:MAG: hypothetical protein R3Y28_01395 [Candidatus Gastranaerophilales bacterium]
MILSEFSKYLQQYSDDILNNKTTSAKILCDWIKIVINKNPKNHVDKIVHQEIMLAQNSADDFLIVAKSESGRTLINALYNFTKSYDNYLMSKWIQDKKPNDFQK